MKKIFIAALIFTSFQIAASGQTSAEQAVANAVEQLRVAMVDADSAMLTRLVLPQLSYGHSSGQVDDKKEFVAKLVSGRSDFGSLEFSGQTISISGKTALVRHILKAKTNDSGKPGEVQLKVLLVWQKKGGHWKLLARQAVKMS